MDKTTDMRENESGVMAFDPIVLVRDVLKRWLIVVLAVVMMGVGTYIYSDMSYQPVYQTRTTFVVTSRSASSTVYSNLSSTSNLASVFTELLNSSLLRKTILAETGLTSFNGSISAAVIEETNLITVTVKASDPRTAFVVAQAIIDHHEDVTYQVVDSVVMEVLQSPTVPTAPTNSVNATGRMKKMALAAGIAAVAAIMALSFMRDTVRSGREARRKLDCSYLGEIPHEKKYKTLRQRLRRNKTGILITNPATSFTFLENFRKLRRRIEQRLHGRKVLMVTSLLENEGKSTVAVNLGLSMAQRHQRVLLIESDLRKPACYKLMERGDVNLGVRDVLNGRAQLGQALLQDKRSGLYMLLETRGSRDSANLTSSEAMRSLIAWARENFDYVILDLPPMAEAPDAETVMEFCDASVLVVRQNAAAAPALNKAIGALRSGKAKLLGCVLNDVTSGLASGGRVYGYGNYRRYGKYSQYAPRTDESGK